MKCADGLQCVHTQYFCDGRPDCNDSSDEHPSTCKGMLWFVQVIFGFDDYFSNFGSII